MQDGPAEMTEMSVRFWGVRGSIASPGPTTVKYGGNTPCIEIRCGDRCLVFDAGTGIRELGQTLLTNGAREVDLFLTHTHVDHIVGFPFFGFAFDPANRLRVWSGHLLPERTTEQVLRTLMSPPLFPVPMDILKAAIEFRDFRAGDVLTTYPGITIRTAPLNHPDRATGYRVEYGGKSICYVTDTQHVVGVPDENVLGLIHDADIVIYDAMFSDEEFTRYQDWGHSTWEECLRLCRLAGVRVPVLFHHLPSRTDAALDVIASAAAKAFPRAIVAREGETLKP